MRLIQIFLSSLFALVASATSAQGVSFPSLASAQWNGYVVVSTNPPRDKDGRPFYCQDSRATVERGKCHVVDWIGRDIGDAIPVSDADYMNMQIRRSLRIPAGYTFEVVGIGPNYVGSKQTKISADTSVVYVRVFPVRK